MLRGKVYLFCGTNSIHVLLLAFEKKWNKKTSTDNLYKLFIRLHDLFTECITMHLKLM